MKVFLDEKSVQLIRDGKPPVFKVFIDGEWHVWKHQGVKVFVDGEWQLRNYQDTHDQSKKNV